MRVSCVQPSGEAVGDHVELFSSESKLIEDMQPGEHGVMPVKGSICFSTFDTDTCRRVQRLSDLGVLREGYEVWYKRQGGRQLERDLMSAFHTKALSTALNQYRSYRFRDVLCKAIELAVTEDQPQLLEACKQVICDDGRLNMESFVELHILISQVNGILHQVPTSTALIAAAARQLVRREFTDILAQSLHPA